MKNKIILVYPKLGPKGKEHRGVPLAVLSIAGMLKSAGFMPEVFDLRVHDIQDIKLDADVLWVGISSMTGYQIKSGLEVAEYVRKINKEIPLVWGGWHPTLLPKETIQHPLVDIIVKGQGEITAVEISNCFKEKLPLTEIEGILYKLNGKALENKNRKLEDINSFPQIPYELVDVSKHLIYDPKNKIKMISYLSSRGCPYSCKFCAISKVYDRKWLALSSERVVADITNLINTYKADGIYFEDDEFFISKTRTQEICRRLLDNKLNLKWAAIGRANNIVKFDDETLNLIKTSGCVRVLIGIESGSQAVLNLIGKKTTIEQNWECIKKLEEYRIEAVLSFMVGFPEELNEFQDTIAFIKKVKKYYSDINIKLFFYTPYPGTELYEYAINNGFKPPEKLEDWAEYTMHKVNVPWLKKNYEQKLKLFLFYFNFTLNPSSKKGLKEKIKTLMAKFINFSSLLRIKYNFFRFPFEYVLYERLKSK